jgi:hypothetical protein
MHEHSTSRHVPMMVENLRLSTESLGSTECGGRRRCQEGVDAGLAHDGAGCISELAAELQVAKPGREKRRGLGKAWTSATKTRHQTGRHTRSAHGSRRAHS